MFGLVTLRSVFLMRGLIAAFGNALARSHLKAALFFHKALRLAWGPVESCALERASGIWLTVNLFVMSRCTWALIP